MFPDRSFREALRIQFRVIGALFMWEVTQRYGRDNLGFLWLFVEPMIFTLAVTALWSALAFTHGPHLSIVTFTLTGYSSILLWRNSANHCCNSIQPRVALLFHRRIRVLDILITKVLLEIAGATASFVILSILWIFVGWADAPVDIAKVLQGWVMLSWLAAALALIVGALTSITEIAERIWIPTSYIMFPLSGAAFMVDWLTPEFREFVLWIPVVHTVELIRDGYFGPVVRTYYDMNYVMVVCLIMSAIGLALVRVASRRVAFQ